MDDAEEEDHGLPVMPSASTGPPDEVADSANFHPPIDTPSLSRREKRKILKKAKRKQLRQKFATEARLEAEKYSQDPVRIQQEAEALEKERLEHEFQERLWLERERKAQEDAERKRREDEERQKTEENEWEYVDDDGPAEIIWEGNEIIVRKKKVRVRKSEREALKDDRPVSNPLAPPKVYEQPVSNPLPPQATAFEEQKKSSRSNLLASIEQTPNFGTEQDKTHCPFHIKTGVCRFGVNCSRVHVYPDKSCTLLIKNMYNGPGLPLDHDEGLEYTDEEIAQYYEEFYSDVHGEFQKYGEIVNFKVCRNESSHLRGNVYIQFQSVDSAITAYNAMNGRFYAGKQITCEFVTVTRWRVALCGEYMRSHHRTCSHGTACNFLHCFRNPHDEYSWADWDSSVKSTSNGHRKKRELENTDHRSHRHHRDRYKSGGAERRSEFPHDHLSRKRRNGSEHSENNSYEDDLLKGYESSRRKRQRRDDIRERHYQDTCRDSRKISPKEYEQSEERDHKIHDKSRRARSHFSKERSIEREYTRWRERRHYSTERRAERHEAHEDEDEWRHKDEMRKRRRRSHTNKDGSSLDQERKESVRHHQQYNRWQESEIDGHGKSSQSSDERGSSRKVYRKSKRQEDEHERRQWAKSRKHRKQDKESQEGYDIDDRYRPRSSSYDPLD